MNKDKLSHSISIRGARTHNLKNIDVDIKLEKITCIAGPSGSGKSSLAFHTILTESKRRFINSLPTDMKFFWEIPHTVEVDSIYPVLPAWGLPQHNPVINSRPVAVDILGSQERIQKIFMILGRYLCPKHKINYEKITKMDSALKKITTQKSIDDEDVVHLLTSKEHYRKFVSSEMNPSRSMSSQINEFDEKDAWFELSRVKYKNIIGLSEKLKEYNLPVGSPLRLHHFKSGKNIDFENHFEFKCPHCENRVHEDRVIYAESLSPLNALGACSHCEGHGMLLVFDREKMIKDPTKSIRQGAINFLLFSRFEHLFPIFLRECKKVGLDIDAPFSELPENKWDFLYSGSGKYEGFNSYFEYLKSLRYKKNIRIYTRSMQREILCEVCAGTRISDNAGALAIALSEEVVTYKDFLKLSFEKSLEVLQRISNELSSNIVTNKLSNSFQKIEQLYLVAVDLGLGHLQNTRKVRSMSSSEYQRLLLSKYLSYAGSQSLFVLDEPSLGLSISAQKKMIGYLRKLRDQGNTIIMVEHSEFLKENSDEVIEMGPAAGERGGTILSQGKYRSPQLKLVIKKCQFSGREKFIEISGAQIRSMNRSELKVQKNALNWVYGESGTGKSSFIVSLLANEIHRQIHGSRLSFEDYKFKKLKGNDDFKDVILINSGLDKISSRSSVATYTDLGAFVRKYFANLEFSKKMGLKDGHFSANSELGQCSSCEGRGVKLIEMHFLEDVEFVCEDCQGKKLKPYYANISDGNLTVYEALSKPLSEVLPYIKLTPKGKRIWDYFKVLKLDYLSLDRTLVSLSGGERQRLQLLSLLDRKTENTLIVFENLTSGLSHHEFAPLANLLQQLVISSNTIIVIDQNTFFDKIANFHIVF